MSSEVESNPVGEILASSSATSLHVNGITRNVRAGHLLEIFSNYGKVLRADLHTDRRTGLSSGTATIEYELGADAEQAVIYLDGGQLDGNVLKVAFILTDNRRRDTSLRDQNKDGDYQSTEKKNDDKKIERNLSSAASASATNDRDRHSQGRVLKERESDHGKSSVLTSGGMGRYGPADRDQPRSRVPDSERRREPLSRGREPPREELRRGNNGNFESRKRPSNTPPRQRRRDSPARRRPSPGPQSSFRRNTDQASIGDRGAGQRGRELGGRRVLSRSRSPDRNRRARRSRERSPPSRRRRSPSTSRSSSSYSSRSRSRSKSSSGSRSRSDSSGSRSRSRSRSSSRSSRSRSRSEPVRKDKDRK